MPLEESRDYEEKVIGIIIKGKGAACRWMA